MPTHALGSTVCAPGHRHRLTVAHWSPHAGGPFGDGPRAARHGGYVLEDRRDPSVQPFPIVRVAARDVKAYDWEGLLELSELMWAHPWAHPWGLDQRGQYLDACAHLFDLSDSLTGAAQRAARHTADELLNEAAIAWWEACSCVGLGGTVLGCECSGTGRVSRITDTRRLVLVEALIAAGLPERESEWNVSWSDGRQMRAPMDYRPVVYTLAIGESEQQEPEPV